jgi:hypothetical protein
MDQTMIIIASAVGSLIAAVAIVLLLRTLRSSRISNSDAPDQMELSWRDYRCLNRLLDPADFEFLRRRGICESQVERLRVERRKIYRLCLRSMAQDFNAMHRALCVGLIQSELDRPELVTELARQRAAFYRRLVIAHFRLTLHGFGLERMPQIDLVKSLEVLQIRLEMFAPAGMAA